MTQMRDITNIKFGKLTALYSTSKRGKKGSVYWHCKCSCGNEIDVSADNLLHGNYKSCGCVQKKNRESVHDRLHIVDGTCVEWLKYRKKRSDSSSGFRGVYKTKRGKYRVTIGLKKVRYQLGTYDTFEEAIDARMKAEVVLHDGFLNAYEKWQEKEKQDPQWAKENPLLFNVHYENGQFDIETNM